MEWKYTRNIVFEKIARERSSVICLAEHKLVKILSFIRSAKIHWSNQFTLFTTLKRKQTDLHYVRSCNQQVINPSTSTVNQCKVSKQTDDGIKGELPMEYKRAKNNSKKSALIP